MSAIASHLNSWLSCADEIESGGYGIARDVHHFVYVSTAVNQLICPSFTSPYNDKREQQNLLRDYQAAHWRLHKRDRMERMHFIVSDSHSLRRLPTPFALLAIFSLLLT